MRGGGIWLGLLVAAIAVGVACGGGGDQRPGRADDGALAGGGGGGDGSGDGGTPLPDGGTGGGGGQGGPDGGTATDGGTGTACADPSDSAVVASRLPSTPSWRFYGKEQGGPNLVYGVSSDDAGNVWVAGGKEGLFLLVPGEERLRRFTHLDGLSGYVDPACGPRHFEVYAVKGGAANTVYVGYRGVDGTSPEGRLLGEEQLRKTGDADKIVFDGAHIRRALRYDISSPPGSSYPTGRDKLGTVFRIEYDAANDRVWFGANHGVAVARADGKVEEHEHAAINGEDSAGNCTILSGDHYGLSLLPNGDPWAGGANRLLRINYSVAKHLEYPGSQGPPIVDVWPDAYDNPNACIKTKDRVDDNISDLQALSDGNVFVGSLSNGLALVTADGTVAFRDSTFGRGHLGAGNDRSVSALERDPTGNGLWIGHSWMGISIRKDGGYRWLYTDVLGGDLVNHKVTDIQSDTFRGQRRMLVGFLGSPPPRTGSTGKVRKAGAIGIYTGP